VELSLKAEAVKLRLLVKRQSVKSTALKEFHTWHVRNDFHLNEFPQVRAEHLSTDELQHS